MTLHRREPLIAHGLMIRHVGIRTLVAINVRRLGCAGRGFRMMLHQIKDVLQADGTAARIIVVRNRRGVEINLQQFYAGFQVFRVLKDMRFQIRRLLWRGQGARPKLGKGLSASAEC